MKPEHWIVAVQIAVTLVGMFIGPWLPVRWPLKRFRSEKWWERQEQVYSSLLEGLSHLRQFNRDALWNAQRGDSFEPSADAVTTVKDARATLKSKIEHGSYLISGEASKALERVLDTEGGDPIEHHEMMEDSLRNAVEIVRKDATGLNKPKRWWE